MADAERLRHDRLEALVEGVVKGIDEVIDVTELT
jgi:hypothetical protein